MIGEAWNGVRDDLARMGTGGMLTEFGACGDDADSVELLRRQTEGADAQLQGWIYWTFKHFGDVTTQNAATETFYDAAGNLQSNKVRALARAYAPIVAGRPTDVLFNARGQRLVARTRLVGSFLVDAAATSR